MHKRVSGEESINGMIPQGNLFCRFDVLLLDLFLLERTIPSCPLWSVLELPSLSAFKCENEGLSRVDPETKHHLKSAPNLS